MIVEQTKQQQNPEKLVENRPKEDATLKTYTNLN